MTFVPRVPGWLVRFIGVCELLGAVGLVVPAATGIAPRVTGMAGAALTLLMVFAAHHQVAHDDSAHLSDIAVLGWLSAQVALVRLARVPIPPHG